MTERYDTTTHRGLDRIERDFDAQHTATGISEMQFAVNERGQRLMSVDPAYRRRVEALYELHYGTTRRNHNGQPVRGR